MSELLTLLMIAWFGRELCLALFPGVVDAMMVRVEDRAVSFLEGLGYRVIGPDQAMAGDEAVRDLEAKVARLEMSLEDRYVEVKALIRERDDLAEKAKRLEYALRDEREEVKALKRRCDLLGNEIWRLAGHDDET